MIRKSMLALLAGAALLAPLPALAADDALQMIPIDVEGGGGTLFVTTNDADSAYAEALALGFEIVRPLTKEAWGVRRFLVRAPDGNVVNIVDHPD